MAYTQPVVGGVTLPHVAGCSLEREHRGSMVQMADGTVAFDVVASDKELWTLKWQAIDDTDKGTIESVYASLATASAAMTTPVGGSITVTRTERTPKFEAKNAAGGLRWDVELEFREV